MIKPTEETLKAIVNLKSSNQSLMFDELVNWLNRSCEKETKLAIYCVDDNERFWASGRTQELRYILDVIETAKDKLEGMKDIGSFYNEK